MLIYIDNTIAEYLRQNQLDSHQQGFFASLALSYQKGKCIVFGQIESIKALITYFGTPINGIYKTILSKYSEYGSLAQWTTTAFIISYRDAGFISNLPTVLEKKSHYYSFKDVSLINWTFGSCLLGENINDCIFYEFIGKYYSKKNKIRNVQISFHHEQGGGSGIAPVLQKCVKIDAQPTLCITDADIEYGATSEYGEPAKGDTFLACDKIRKQLENAGYKDCFCFTHNFVREVENLVPLSLLKLLDNSICMPEGIRILEELEKINNGEPILYYDFKKGETIELGTPHGQYWNEIFSRIPKWKDEKIFGKIVCEHFLERVNNFINENGLVCISLDPYLVSTWNKLGQIIFTWGCSSCPTRA